MEPNTRKAVTVSLTISPLITLPLIISLIYGAHNELDVTMKIFLIVMINVMFPLIAAALGKYAKRPEESPAQKRMRKLILFPIYFPMIGATLTRIFGKLYLFLGLSVSAAVISYIFVLVAYYKDIREGADYVPIAGQVIMVIRFIFGSAMLYGVLLSLTYFGEWGKIKELF